MAGLLRPARMARAVAGGDTAHADRLRSIARRPTPVEVVRVRPGVVVPVEDPGVGTIVVVAAENRHGVAGQIMTARKYHLLADSAFAISLAFASLTKEPTIAPISSTIMLIQANLLMASLSVNCFF